MDENNLSILSVLFVIILIITMIGGGIIYSHHHRLEVYQSVITELDDDQKCMYQCSFAYPTVSTLDNYKFCLEKCDRIAERKGGCE